MSKVVVLNLGILIFVACISWILTKFSINILRSYGVIDFPSERRLHKEPTVRGGGIALLISFTIGFILLSIINFHSSFYLIRFLPLLICIGGISFLDDIYTVHPFLRLIVHLFCSVGFILLILQKPLFQNILEYRLGYVITIFGLAGFVNIYNFLDGVDGLTASNTVYMGFVMLMLCSKMYDIIYNVDFVITCSILVIICSISFLYFNWSPAEVFLGDVGSITLGFIIASCMLIIAVSSLKLLLACFIASLYYIADGGGVLLFRLISGEKVWLPHNKHFFQRSVAAGMSHAAVTAKIMVCNLLLGILSILSLTFPFLSVVSAIMIIISFLSYFAFYGSNK